MILDKKSMQAEDRSPLTPMGFKLKLRRSMRQRSPVFIAASSTSIEEQSISFSETSRLVSDDASDNSSRNASNPVGHVYELHCTFGTFLRMRINQ